MAQNTKGKNSYKFGKVDVFSPEKPILNYDEVLYLFSITFGRHCLSV